MKPMLAGKFDEAKVEARLPLYGQTKFDGIRVFANEGIAHTRSLKAARSEQLQSFFAHNADLLHGLDGEIICGDPTAENCYSITDSHVMSFDKYYDDMRFYVFDKWDEPAPFQTRMEIAQQMVEEMQSLNMIGNVKVIFAETELLWDIDDVWEFHNKKVGEGHEGIILRSPDQFYKYGRGTPSKCECIKMKEGGWVDTEVRILEFHEEMENTNEQTRNLLGYAERSGHRDNFLGKGTLGALEVAGTFEDGREFTCRVGTGFDHATRQAVWNNKEKFANRLVKMRYFKVGIKDKPRFPTFLGFRDELDLDPPNQMSLF